MHMVLTIFILAFIIVALGILSDIMSKKENYRQYTFYVTMAIMVLSVAEGITIDRYFVSREPKEWTAEDWYQGRCKRIDIYERPEDEKVGVKVGHRFVDAAVMPQSEDKEDTITVPTTE